MVKKISCRKCETVFSITPEMLGNTYRCRICATDLIIPRNFFSENYTPLKPSGLKPANQSDTDIAPTSDKDSHKDQLNRNDGLSTRQIFGIIGSITLFIGVFMPVVSIPIVGNINYFMNGKGDGTLILVLAAISFVLVLTKRYGGLWITGACSLGIMFLTYLNFQTRLSQVKAGMESELAGNPYRGLADAAVQAIQLQWGWGVLIVGAALIFTAAAMNKGGSGTP